MCDTCGCSQPDEAVTFRKPGEEQHHHHHHHGEDHGHSHNHDHDHDHDHHHHHENTGNRTLAIEKDILQQNNLLAQRNRGWFDAKNILALNLVSSPGSGKTTLLEMTIKALGGSHVVSVIEGDQQTLNDANRIAATGAPVIQVNTGQGCHLDAKMIERACHELDPANGSLLMIENVGNLVCPALFDLGEAAKVVVISVTEGDDKPSKYPTMFAASDICIINKIDLLPYVQFDIDKCEQAAREVNPKLKFFRVSATTSEGMDSWLEWLKARSNSSGKA